MKPIFSLITFFVALTTYAANGEGYFFFMGNTRSIWENFTPPGNIIVAPSNSLKVAFLFGSGVPLIGNAGSPTNAATPFVPSSLFLNDPNFTFATNSATGQLVVGITSNNGSFNYNSASAFPVAGTVSGTVYNVYALAWSSAFPTPQSAAGAGGIFGWSNTFSYNAVENINAPLTFTQSGMTPFGLIIPEPSSASLLILGMLATATYHRRK